MRLAVIWPRPRKDRWRLGQLTPDQSPDLSDALLFLEDEGIHVTLEDSCGLPWNPLARMHEFYSGLDPVRAARVAWRSRRYDAALCVGDASAFFLVWLRRLIGFRLPLIIVDPSLTPGYPRRKRLQDVVLPRARKVVVFGRCQIDYLREAYGDRVDAAFLHHRADVNFYAPAPGGPPRQSEVAYIFSIGNDASRDFETLVQAADRCARLPGFTHRFRVHTRRTVTATGPLVDVHSHAVSHGQLRELYRQASLVVIPLQDTTHAGGINSLLEAMACGRPVITSRSRGVADYVVDGKTARVVPPGDPGALAGAITELLASPEGALALGNEARQFVVQTCDNRIYARKLAAIIREAAAPS